MVAVTTQRISLHIDQVWSDKKGTKKEGKKRWKECRERKVVVLVKERINNNNNGKERRMGRNGEVGKRKQNF